MYDTRYNDEKRLRVLPSHPTLGEPQAFNQEMLTNKLTNLLVEVFDAVYLVGGIHCERDPIKGLAADDASEAVRVVRLACRSQQLTGNRPSVNICSTQYSQGRQGIIWLASHSQQLT